MFPSPAKLKPTGHSMPEIHRKPVPILKQGSFYQGEHPQMGEHSQFQDVLRGRPSQETSESPSKSPEWMSAMQAMIKGAGGTFKRFESKASSTGRPRISPDGQMAADSRRVRFNDSDSLPVKPTDLRGQALERGKRRVPVLTSGRLNPGLYGEACSSKVDHSTTNTLQYSNETGHVTQGIKASNCPIPTSTSSFSQQTTLKNSNQTHLPRSKNIQELSTKRNQFSPTAEYFQRLPVTTSSSRLHRLASMDASHPSLIPEPLAINHDVNVPEYFDEVGAAAANNLSMEEYEQEVAQHARHRVRIHNTPAN